MVQDLLWLNYFRDVKEKVLHHTKEMSAEPVALVQPFAEWSQHRSCELNLGIRTQERNNKIIASQ